MDKNKEMIGKIVWVNDPWKVKDFGFISKVSTYDVSITLFQPPQSPIMTRYSMLWKGTYWDIIDE